MSRPSATLRRLVWLRAGGQCEYCGVHEADGRFRHQVDHVLSQKHGGPTWAENLALSCILCNRRKGSDTSSIDPRTHHIVRLYNPRKDRWSDHFAFDGPRLSGLTQTGRATIELLELNDLRRVMERRALWLQGRWQPPQQPSR